MERANNRAMERTRLPVPGVSSRPDRQIGTLNLARVMDRKPDWGGGGYLYLLVCFSELSETLAVGGSAPSTRQPPGSGAWSWRSMNADWRLEEICWSFSPLLSVWKHPCLFQLWALWNNQTWNVTNAEGVLGKEIDIISKRRGGWNQRKSKGSSLLGPLSHPIIRIHWCTLQWSVTMLAAQQCGGTVLRHVHSEITATSACFCPVLATCPS